MEQTVVPTVASSRNRGASLSRSSSSPSGRLGFFGVLSFGVGMSTWKTESAVPRRGRVGIDPLKVCRVMEVL